MKSLRRILRRKQKQYIVLSLLSLLNLIFPHSASAAAPEPVTPDVAIEQQTELLPEIQEVVLQKELLPTVAPVEAKRSGTVVATAYTSSVDETDSDPWITASGKRTGDGIIAANSLRFGTRVRFPDQYGDKIFIVQDRMNARYGSGHVDIWMPEKQIAKQWGVKAVRMEIL